MNGYFKPLRRKFGIATLVMACVSIVGWVRSSTNSDALQVGMGKRLLLIESGHGSVRSAFASVTKGGVDQYFVRPYTFTFAGKTVHRNLLGQFGYKNETFMVGHPTPFVPNPGPSVPVRQISAQDPYWSIVIPLALLSAWLLLSQPRRKSFAQTLR